MKYILSDTFNDKELSRHRTLAAAIDARHSPLPWHIAEYGIRELKAKYLCIKHGSRTIARIDASGNSLSVTPTDEANARLIVRSVNHAQALAEALRDMLSLVDDLGLTTSTTRDNAREALANWEEAKHE